MTTNVYLYAEVKNDIDVGEVARDSVELVYECGVLCCAVKVPVFLRDEIRASAYIVVR